MARYDGHASWYDEAFGAGGAGAPGALTLRALLSGATGRWLDVACGTGALFDILHADGRDVVGIDVSADQLRVARLHDARTPVIQGDATRLPFPTGAFDGVTATFVHTDVDDVAPVFEEAARVLRDGGTLVHVGTHPCFTGHFVERRGDGRRIVHDGYLDATWHDSSPFFGPGIRRRVGARHVPLAELLNAIVDAGLRIVHVDEPAGDQIVPITLAVVAEKR